MCCFERPIWRGNRQPPKRGIEVSSQITNSLLGVRSHDPVAQNILNICRRLSLPHTHLTSSTGRGCAMDPLTAIGLAGNILAFIDFSYKVISGANKVLSNSSGMTSENESLTVLVVDLNLVTQKLSTDITAQTENERQLCALAANCYKLSEELKHIIASLKLGDRQSKWDGLKVKWRSMRKEKDVDSIERRLNGYQSQILIRLQVMFRFVF